jgi:GTP-binding protein HflX
LDTTVRKLHPPSKPGIVVADTVGFLRDLPNHLLASFGSTLREALDAQLLVLVLDGSDEEWPAHLRTTLEVLQQVEAAELPRLVLVNKLDRMSEEDRQLLLQELPEALLVSARSAPDVTRVHEAIVAFFDAGLAQAELRVPFRQASLRAEILAEARNLSEPSDDEGGLLTIRAEPATLARWRAQLGA